MTDLKEQGQRLFFMLFVLVIVSGLPGCSQQTHENKVFRIGVVNLNQELDKVFNGFKKGLADLGHIEGRDITYLYNGSRTDIAEVESDLRSFIDQHVDLIFSITTPAAKKTKDMTAGTGIPVVFAPVFDPVASGIVQNLLKPGGNMTGIKVGGNSEKALEWLVQIAPAIRKILVPFSSNNRATVQSLKGLRAGADKLDIALMVREVADREQHGEVLEDVPADADAIWLLNSHFLAQNADLFVASAIKHRLPVGSSTSQVDDGIMVTYGQDAFRTGEMAADLAHKIMEGISPADLPVEVTDYFLGINLITAQAIGIDISDDILHVASTIIRP